MGGEDKKRVNFLSLITTPNPEWDKKIAFGIRTKCEALAGIKADFQTQSFYVKNGETFTGGISVEQHGDILWSDSLWVEPHFRKKGIGKMLIENIMHFSVAEKAKDVPLNTYFKEAHAFFLACGVEDVAEIPHWKYDLTCYLMRKNL